MFFLLIRKAKLWLCGSLEMFLIKVQYGAKSKQNQLRGTASNNVHFIEYGKPQLL